MKEKILTNKKNGMLRLGWYLIVTLLAVIAVASGEPALIAVGVIWLSVGWIVLLGLRILKPQEALVLTLFGKYYGTIKGEGFYAVNPFCSSVNPAAKTELNQSG
ncbi:MAG: SPFH domain-containing protein, partial [Lachnospiraceae bacterium]|nr:SPFH domain-containing protein [Lachnospiraceae bacterium]